MRSLRSRLLVGMLGGIALLLVLFGFGVYEAIRRALMGEFDSALAATARSLAAAVEHDEGEIEIEFDVRKLPEFDRTERPAYFQFWRTDGTVLRRSPSLGQADLPRSASSTGSPVARALMLPNGRSGRAAEIRFTPRDDEADKGTESATRAAAGEVILVVGRDTLALEAKLGSLRWLLLLGGAATMTVALLVSLLVARRGLRPLDSLAVRIAGIRTEDLAYRIPTGRMPAEIIPVGEKLNDLLARLEAAFQRERSLTADVAHELRTPLAGVRSTLEVALSRPREAPEYREALSDCLAIAKRMQSMTGNLLTLARLDTGQTPVDREQIHPAERVESCWQEFADRAELRGIGFENAIPAELSCTSNGEALAMVLSSLLDNAVEYADEGGRVRVTGQAASDSVEITVANTGCGLSQDDARRVFDRFWRGDAARTNTGVHYGLGLAVAQRLVQVLGGAVSANVSDTGVFSVQIVLPA